MDILQLVKEFYAIEAVTAMLSANTDGRLEVLRHSHSKWHRDFTDYRNEFNQKLASAIFDYTAVVVAAELRHCMTKASQYIGGYYSKDSSRDAVYRECSIYNPVDILQAGLRMFSTDRVQWKSSFGGDKWMNIAKAGMMKGKVSDCIFIDHCVDLSHNNSVYFDKCAGIFNLMYKGIYQAFLDLKHSCEPQVLLHESRGRTFNHLLVRANNLGIINTRAEKNRNAEAANAAEKSLLSYRPIEWGDRRLDYSEGNIVINFAWSTNERTRRSDDDSALSRSA